MRRSLVPILFAKPGWVLPGATLDMDFANNRAWRKGVGLILPAPLLTTTRASTGYATTSSGLLVPFLSNIPRITDLGLLVEQAATNLVLQSQTFDSAFWTKNNCTVTADQAVAPDGTQTADLVVPAAASGTYKTVQSGGVGIALTGNAAVSVYYEPSGYGFLAIVGSSNVGRLTVNVASNTFVSYGAAGLSAVSTALGNGWYRVVVSATAWASGASVWFGPINSQADPSTAWTADGVSGGYLWGAQGEAGTFPTSYIPTTTVSVARAADAITSTVPSLATNVGSMLASVGGAAALGGALFNTHNSTETDPIYAKTSTTIAAYINGDKAVATLGSGTISGAGKYAIGFDGSGHSLVGNNGTVATNAGTFNNTSTLTIGSVAGSGSFYNGYIKRITLWQNKLADAQLKALTQ